MTVDLERLVGSLVVAEEARQRGNAAAAREWDRICIWLANRIEMELMVDA